MNHQISLPFDRQEAATRAAPDLAPGLPALARTRVRLLARMAAALRRAEQAVTERFRVPPNGA